MTALPAILVIDDRECELFEAAFKAVDVDIVCLHSCKAALAYLAEHTVIKVIVTDLAMPGLTGFDFLEKIDTDKYKVAVLTGHPVTSIVAEVLRAAGVDKVFIKGTSIGPTVREIKQWLMKS